MNSPRRMADSVSQAVAAAVVQWMDSGEEWLRAERGELVLLGSYPDEGPRVFDSPDAAGVGPALASITWFSYRREFPPLVGSDKERSFTSDKGWGCVHRCGQMLLCAALARHLGVRAVQLLRHFRDEPDAPFSIHRIAQAGEAHGCAVGQWFAPSTIARVLHTLVASQGGEGGVCAARPLSVHLADEDGWAVRLDQVYESARAGNGVLLLLPVRVGLERVDPRALEPLELALRSRYSVGIIGGRPGHSLYFCGYRGGRLSCLDPHTVQPAHCGDGPPAATSFVDPRRHCVAADSLEPSLVLGFYARDTEAVDALYAEMLSSNQSCSYPIFSLMESKRDDDLAAQVVSWDGEASGECTATSAQSNHNGEDDDWVLA
eukprot:TRINITY_DN18879_c0_g4_i1.p1 TRINITY_DN18879_c0_g4~~TRINITY_DN18879_c0_g4_i1.p1  ORF type:complete len:375 (+),score=105.05 TRINITY_DN18879_c0_g4_i1:64-1188(+)